ncbi:MAG TPA: glycosyl hydrolase [Cytophagales bacterium]|nr:glycosyl hydrolase [Cytophagales bacterium]HAA21362.1 glycosyl hydrolase [Cytophagales bacterium]HAP58920.1 glycosyl hydrolase [Cytophagales bacterium]
MGHKIAFGVGMLANQMFPAALGIFMVVLVQNLGFPGWMYSLVYFLPRLSDAFTDPIMGFISDNTKSKWGRRRQYVIIGALVMGAAFAIMWQLSASNTLNANFTYFFGWSFVFYLGLTIFSVPYVAMGYEMSDDFHERTNIMATAQLIGQLAWVLAPWIWVIIYNDNLFPPVMEGGEVVVEPFEIGTHQLSIGIAVLFTFCAMVPGLFIPSKSTLNENYDALSFANIGNIFKKIGRSFVEAFSSKPFRQLCFSTFLVYNAFMTISGFSFFIIVWHLFGGVTGPEGSDIWPTLFGSVGAAITTAFVIPIVARMSRKLGKKKAFMVSQAISIVGYLSFLFLFVPGKPWLFLLALPFHSFGIGSLFTLMMSMTADVIDLDELNHGERREGVFGAIYWYMVKFGFAIAGGLSGVILAIVGFDGDLAVQPPGAIDGLRYFFTGLPILGTVGALLIMRNYNITEEKSNEIRAELDRRKAEKEPVEVPQASSYYATDMLQSFGGLNGVTKVETDTDFAGMSEADLRSQFTSALLRGLHGMSFSPYLEGQNVGDQLTEVQIRQRMEIIAPYTQWVRSFSSTDGNEHIAKAAHDKGIKTLAGAWIDGDLEKNEREIAGIIASAKAGHVDVVAVGNEVLLRGDLSKEELLEYIRRVKQALPHLPVGCVEPYFQFQANPDLVAACDVVLANCYPFWEGSSVEQATVYLDRMYDVAQEAANGKPVMITETGWPSCGENTNQAVPSDDNAMKYFINTNNWRIRNRAEVFYFSSFDESWKIRHEGDVGQSWGIWDKDGELKYSEKVTS